MNRLKEIGTVGLRLRTNEAYRCTRFWSSKASLSKEDIRTKRARLLYQSKKRGILENDLILGEFAEEMLPKMGDEQLMRYDKIINGEHMEWDLYYYMSGKKNPPPELEDCVVFKMLRNFVNKKIKASERNSDLRESDR